ncbi:MAG: FAD-binding oxidoreductase [Candidatus Korobacteraceae bacterium]
MSTVTTPVRFTAELRDICGAQHVIEDPARLERAQVLGVAPGVAVEPASTEEIAAILHFANEHGLSVVPAGGFTQQQTGNVPSHIDVLLYTSRLTEVEHYDPGDLTIGIGAGCTIAHLSSKVGADGLLFAGDAPLPERATVGGLLATGMTGPLRHGYGGLRDYCIGIKFVSGDGRKGKGGGRVVKNVAGFDMMKLLIGSRGTLGIITGASFKLFPAPRRTSTFVAGFATVAEAIQYRNAVLRSPLSPMCLELVSPQAGALLPGGGRSGKVWSIYIRAAGSDAVLGRYRTELGAAIALEIDGHNEYEVWRAIEDFSHTLPERYPDSVLISLSLPLADVQPVLNELESVAASRSLTLAAIGTVGVGRLLAGLWPATGSKANLVAAVSAFHDRLSHDASAAVLHCPNEMRPQAAAWEKTPTHFDSMRAIKRAMDPKDILNRGRFLF